MRRKKEGTVNGMKENFGEIHMAILCLLMLIAWGSIADANPVHIAPDTNREDIQAINARIGSPTRPPGMQGRWYTMTVDTVGDVGIGNSLAIGADAYPRISYFDDTHDVLKYAWQDGFGWNNQTVDDTGEVGRFTSLKIGADGYAGISYDDSTTYDLKYAWQGELPMRYKSGTILWRWYTEIVESGGDVGWYNSLAIGADGYPRISYSDRQNYDLKYTWKDSFGWNMETVDSTGDVGRFTSLATGTDGYPRISYYDTTHEDLKYAWKDGYGWHNETVDSAGSVGRFTSLAIGADGYPRISYFDDTNYDLKYTWKDSFGWHNETVDSAGDVGRFTSLALGEGGLPRISYYDLTNGDLKYAWQDGYGWHNETVDSAGDVGQYPSLAIGAGGYPQISYYDITNSALKYARFSPPPTVTGITPNNGTLLSTVHVTDLQGTGFFEGTKPPVVKLVTVCTAPPCEILAPISATNVHVVSPTKITCDINIPAARKRAGIYDVKVVNPDGQAGVLKNGFVVRAPPVVTGIVPNTAVSGSEVYISNLSGLGFHPGPYTPGQAVKVNLICSGFCPVTFPPIKVSNITVVSPTKITCTITIPSNRTGTYNVRVTNPDGLSGTLKKGFTIAAPSYPPPRIISITPNKGALWTTVTITNLSGIGFREYATVRLRKTGYSDITMNASTITPTKINGTFTLGGAVTGWWNLVVTNPDGQYDNKPNAFRVVSTPTYSMR